ncbi:MAG: Coenzyme F420 hydrogenase/dehydrogenase, beta subunit C-terminal domain [Candidatus Methanospirareceae archaeon]
MLVELIIEKSKGFRGLKEEVIDKNLCAYCGACASFCEHISLEGGIPVLKEECSLDKEGVMKCSENGTCYDICPMTATDVKELERMFLSQEGEEDEDLGVYMDLVAGKTSIEGQDGGIVTSLLIAGMEKGKFDSVIVAERGEDFNAVAKVAHAVEEVEKAKGTKYVQCPMVAMIGRAVKGGGRKIAIVGTPCQIRAVRKLQKVLLNKVPQIEITTIGLFCFESFLHDALVRKTKELLGVDVGKASKMQITKGKYIVEVDGKTYETKVSNLNEAMRNNCHYCDDFVSRLADISVGSVGSEDGFSTIIIRTEKGRELLDLIEFTKGEVNKEEIRRVARLKKKRTQKG